MNRKVSKYLRHLATIKTDNKLVLDKKLLKYLKKNWNNMSSKDRKGKLKEKG